MLYDILALIPPVEKRKYQIPFQDNMQISMHKESSSYSVKLFLEDVLKVFFRDTSYALSGIYVMTVLGSYC